MRIVCTYDKLREAVENSERIVTRNLTLPILNNFLLKTEGNNLKISSTNLEIGVTTQLICKLLEGGEITIPARVFQGIINNLETERVQLETKEKNTLVIKTEKYKGELKGESAGDFPIIPKLKKETLLTIDSQELAAALNQVVAFTSVSETRPEITGVLFHKKKNQEIFSLVSTDSFRLAEREVPVKKEAKSLEFSFIVPQKTANEVLRALTAKGEVMITIDKNQVAFNLPNYNLVSRLIEGNYPDYTNFVPQKFKTELIVDKERLIKTIRLVGLLSSRVNDIKISFKKGKTGTMSVYARDPDLGENSSSLDAQITGEELEVSFNWHYLIEGLQHIEGKRVSFKFNESTKPVLIKSSQGATNFIYIVMPIRV